MVYMLHAMQLRELITQLDTTGLHFVRCIKPNAALKPGAALQGAGRE